MKVATYSRVSTQDQSVDMQRFDLQRYCEQRRFEVYREYCDHGVSGSKDHRPALNELMADARKRKFDVVLVWRFDRFARSVEHLIKALEKFGSLKIDFISLQEQFDTSTPIGQAMFTIIGVMAQLERDIIRERVKAGLERARANGVRLGRPTAEAQSDQVKVLREQGLSLGDIADRLKCSRSTVRRRLSETQHV